MMPKFPLKQAPLDLTHFSQSPSAARLCFPGSHQRSEISSLSKVILIWGKARSLRVPNLGRRGAVNHVGDLRKIMKKLDA